MSDSTIPMGKTIVMYEQPRKLSFVTAILWVSVLVLLFNLSAIVTFNLGFKESMDDIRSKVVTVLKLHGDRIERLEENVFPPQDNLVPRKTPQASLPGKEPSFLLKGIPLPDQRREQQLQEILEDIKLFRKASLQRQKPFCPDCMPD